MQLAHAVDAEGHGHAQVGHVHLPVADDGHVANALPLIGIAFEQLGAHAAVQLLQDHVDAGKRLLHHIDGPALQRLGHDGMVGVGHAAVGDALRHLPGKTLLIDQQTDQLGNRQARMRVVDVEYALVRQQIKVVAKVLFEILDRILQGGAGEEVVLLEAQHLALVVLIFGIEHLGDHLGHLHFLHGLEVFTLSEVRQVQIGAAAGRPGAQRVDAIVVVAHHGHIIGHGVDLIGVHELKDLSAVFLALLHMAVELHGAGIFGTGDFPDVAVLQPVIRKLHLLALHQLLAEQTILVADGAAHGRNVQAGQAIQKAGGQAAQTAVAQRGFGLLRQDGLQVDAQLAKRLSIVFLRAKVDQVAIEGTAG